jgi:uncharacterized protein YjeT (DUF2065 family)
MPADLSALLDTLLVVAGLVLVATGLVMFVRSKTSTQASLVEAFGIKLNVTHPSLILVLAGVGLMLAPRLLPEPAGRSATELVAATDEPHAAEPRLSVTPAAAPAGPSAPAPAVAAGQQDAPTVTPAQPAPPASAATARPIPAPKPAQAARAAAKPPAEPPASAAPALKPAAGAATVLAGRPAAMASPAAATKAAPPTLVYAALGLPISRGFWNGETRASYTRRMHAALQQTGRDVLHMDSRGLELGEREFDAWWNEPGEHPRSRELCAAPDAPRALLTARVETPTTISSVESASWPELKLRLYVCARQRMYRQQKTLAPQNDDAWPFSVELNSEIERFLRLYRSDMAN